MKTLILILSLIAPFALAENMECPRGSKENELVLARVMRNFGRFTLNADSVALKSQQSSEDIQDKSLQEARRDLAIAAVCAETVLNNPTGDLLPEKAHQLQGQERQVFVRDFLEFMARFHDALLQYQAAFDQALKVSPHQRSFSEIQKNKRMIDDLANEAHRHLGHDD
ncbi:MAG: hypothetical protein COT73_11235 [Bdellovibrio sp. CG10_big_fil_rev_8_21_14_0_10_47_8]|nr:MAG: hypothetical protein COT73_11235 [Bdellovibrio sp. CG10_big_fil_rev_8_21_14_0_10_47_8]